MEILNCFNINKQKMKFPYAVALMVIFAVSFIVVTVGFFTPVWYTSMQADPHNGYDYDTDWVWRWHYHTQCDSVGLVSGDCRYPYTHLYDTVGELGYVLRVVFFIMVSAMCLLYVSTIFMIIGAVFTLYKNQVFLTFLAIFFGVFYPVATLLVQAGCIYAEVCYPYNIGYSLILSHIGGSLMLVACIMMCGFGELFKKTKIIAAGYGEGKEHETIA